MDRRKVEQSGFTVIEILVVVGIIVLIAAISLPSLLGARQKATQASAVASIKAINTAESVYLNNYPALGYSASLSNLGSNGSNCETVSATNACLLDPVLSSGIKDGYTFDLLGDGNTPDSTYSVVATPQQSGECAFSSDQSGVIQSQAGGSSQQGSRAGGSTTGGGASCGAN